MHIKTLLCGLIAGTSLFSLTACSSPGTTPDGAAQTYLRSLGRKDSSYVCTMIIMDGVQPLQKGSPQHRQCVSSVDSWLGRVDPDQVANLKNATVKGASVSGETASVSSEDIKGVLNPMVSRISLKRFKGMWYITG